MDTMEEIARRLHTTEELGNIVRTMKALSAVNIRQYEVAEQALDAYTATIEQGLQIVLRGPGTPATQAGIAGGPAPALGVVFGSDLGLCGRFNDDIVAHARRHFGATAADTVVSYVAIGERAAAQLEASRERVVAKLDLPASVHGLTAMARRVVMEIDRQRAAAPTVRVLLFHNRRRRLHTAQPHSRLLLPLDSEWLRELRQRRWEGATLPTCTMDPAALFAALVAEHLFIALFRAGAASGASEHATRLAAMQSAEHNIEEGLEALSQAYRQQRQAAITEELLDIVAGYEAAEN